MYSETKDDNCQNDGAKESLAEESALPFLIGDKRRLLQVLINLVKNSLKFT